MGRPHAADLASVARRVLSILLIVFVFPTSVRAQNLSSRSGIETMASTNQVGSAALDSLIAQARGGDAKAQYRLATLYDDGRQVPSDPAEALKWYKAAAQGGSAQAQYRLGYIFENEMGRNQDRDQAIKYYRMAAAHGNAAAMHALRTMLRPEQLTGPRQLAPAYAISRVPAGVLPQLDLLDQKALAAELAAYNPGGAPSPSTLASWKKIEDALTSAREAAWRAMSTYRALPLLIAEPLELAMLDLEIEVRRAAGPKMHTIVSGIDGDRGCAGDFTGDRLLYRYGSLLANGNPGGADADAVVLDQMSRQFACLGAGQTAHLEDAINQGFDAVSARMQSHGFGGAIPAFVRVLAPVQLLMFDVRKHLGEDSAAYRWFVKNHDLLAAQVQRGTGWATGNIVFLWDRRLGRLAGFPPCVGSQPDCVDQGALVDSTNDPLAIGTGDCGLAAMVSHGITAIRGRIRYICPSLPCNQQNPVPQPDEVAKLKSELQNRYPSTTIVMPDQPDMSQNSAVKQIRDPSKEALLPMHVPMPSSPPPPKVHGIATQDVWLPRPAVHPKSSTVWRVSRWANSAAIQLQMAKMASVAK